VSSPVPLPAAAEAVLTFLESVGRRSEAELYLRLFHKLPKESFAIIAPGGPVLRYALGSVVEQLKFLADLGLYAPVVLGLFDPQAGVSGSERLSKRLPAAGLPACPHEMTEPDLHERIAEELRSERVPIVHFRKDEEETLDARLERIGALVKALDTRKFVLLRRRGGLKPRVERKPDVAAALSVSEGRISIINLRSDAERLNGGKSLSKRDLELLACSKRLIELVDPNPLLVSITSPLNLLKELFTVKGAGTLIKRGSLVERRASFDEVDLPRLRSLLEASFGRTLEPGFLDRPPLAIYLEASYRGAAVIHPAGPAPYLSKFAVLPEAQGEGIGGDVWAALARDYPALFWRARSDNPIASWYATVCDGMARGLEWTVYWRGVPPSAIPQVIADAEGRPNDFS
jgi:hypothetical protein